MGLSVALPSLVLNVPAIANRTEREVQRVLGPPAQTTSGGRLQRHPRLSYRHGTVEIIFVDGRAECIVLHDTRALEFHQRSLAKLGLPVTKPSKTERGKVLRWDSIRGVREVAMYAGGRHGVSHVRISVHTAPAQH